MNVLAQSELDTRAIHPTIHLRRAHHALDRAVDRLYRAQPFLSDRDRVEHLFGRYEALVNPLGTAGVRANRRVARTRPAG